MLRRKIESWEVKLRIHSKKKKKNPLRLEYRKRGNILKVEFRDMNNRWEAALRKDKVSRAKKNEENGEEIVFEEILP